MTKNLQKIVFYKSPLVIAAAICFLIAILIPLFVGNTTKSKPSDVKGITKHISPTAASTPTEAVSEDFVVSPTVAEPSPTTASQSKQSDNKPNTPTATPVPQQAEETFQVDLSINGSFVGSVAMQKEQNQCDVLNRAKDQGKISSLLMKYDNSLGTYGVYQINGIGKENSVWWVYKLNGQSPGQGCSYIKVKSGDKIEWEYKG